jgi:2-aminoethylphosphonate-pyruvate transaminase
MDKLLFTPGPLTTSETVRAAMSRDLGSRDADFLAVVAEIRRRLVELAGGVGSHTAVIVQGSGTFGVEGAIGTALPRDGKLLIASNGAYGARLAQIAAALRIDREVIPFAEDRPIDPLAIERALAADPRITHVAVVHGETSTGMINPIDAVAAAVARHGRQLIVDAMSTFGGVPIDVSRIDYLISSANKCLEGVPGFSFVIARESSLTRAEGQARSLSLDLHAQWRGLERDGQFRFTPPTHALLAFRQALDELSDEGGVVGRAARYRRNHEVVVDGMRRLGFEPYLPDERRGWIITSFRSPPSARFDFKRLYEGLSARGFVIYPGKVSKADCFRIGHIGRIAPKHCAALVEAIEAELVAMGVRS